MKGLIPCFKAATKLSIIFEIKSIVLLWDEEAPPEDQNNSSEMRLCRVSDEIIRV